MSNAVRSFRIGVDIGGTFTDMVLVSGERMEVVKVPTVPTDPAAGVVAALEKAAQRLQCSVPDLLSACESFVHGSTVATNAILEGKGAKVGLVTSDGFRDALEIRRGVRESPWSHREPYAPVLVPRHRRLPVRGRIEKDGSVTRELEISDLQKASGAFRSAGIESVAISLYNGYLRPDQEQRIADVLRAEGLKMPMTLSSTIAPLVGEYERTSTAVLNAYIAPKTSSYLIALASRLKALGLRPAVMLVQSNAGAISVEEVAERPVALLLSGPAAGVGALRYYQAAIGSNNLISMEIGGTSCDVVLVDRGNVGLTDQLQIGGYRVMTPSVEVNTIGAGGGTIARVDMAGMLEVGPEGAGARPGPACFGFGGEEPTITDAQVVLGRLKAGAYANGTINIDLERARAAIDQRIAKPLGISCEEAASGIIRLMEQKLLGAVQQLSVERGYDPSRFTLVAAGGAGPMHGASVARQLGCSQAYVPRVSGAFCALGMLHVNARHDLVRTLLQPLHEATDESLGEIFHELSETAVRTLRREGFADKEIVLERALNLNYAGQQADIQVPLGDGPLDREQVRQRFEALHQQFFGHIQPDGLPSITKVRLAGIGLLPPLPNESYPLSDAGATPLEHRRVWIDADHAWLPTPVYGGKDLKPGMQIAGPAIIDEGTTTILIGAQDRVSVDRANNYLVTINR
ncbi:MAG: hydantoinase/oxoprolinase family protein [Burkholderiaceae bacterium]|nr:hydantoinase/oxoprolinase family protein [Burkholderiaceae bacterium]